MDVGGGRGTLLSRVLAAAPKAQGILFDMPHVIEMAKSSLRSEAAADVVERIESTGGSFLESVPSGADLYMLKSIMVDWPDAQVARLLANLHRAMGPGSRLLIVDWFGRDAADAGRVVEGYEATVSFSAWTPGAGGCASARSSRHSSTRPVSPSIRWRPLSPPACSPGTPALTCDGRDRANPTPRDRSLDVNTKGAFFTIQRLAPSDVRGRLHRVQAP
ncbi:methyltransferase [Streptomyces sp. JCM 35825]|nr:methyltransferase [Streptomyces sp. JCM 35825]WCL90077.1 methyltransferase [Streptomyces sp. JCM 35825]